MTIDLLKQAIKEAKEIVGRYSIFYLILLERSLKQEITNKINKSFS